MRKGGGHSKGSEFERQIAKAIVKAFRKHGIKQRECWRSCLSGGHAISAGDLYMSDRLIELFPFAVECKFYRKIDWKNFWMREDFKRPKSKELQWWKQAQEGAHKRRGLKPVLVLKENRGGVFAVFESVRYGRVVVPFSMWLKRMAK